MKALQQQPELPEIDEDDDAYAMEVPLTRETYAAICKAFPEVTPADAVLKILSRI